MYLILRSKTENIYLSVSDVYGYGIINAKNFISMALTWKSLPAQHTCESDFINDPMYVDQCHLNI